MGEGRMRGRSPEADGSESDGLSPLLPPSSSLCHRTYDVSVRCLYSISFGQLIFCLKRRKCLPAPLYIFLGPPIISAALVLLWESLAGEGRECGGLIAIIKDFPIFL